jgi:hypothetical protein
MAWQNEEKGEQPSCWLSLDQSEGDLRIFLRNAITTLQQQPAGSRR